MTDQDVQTRLELVRHVIRDSLKGFVGQKLDERTLAGARLAVTLALTHADFGLRPYVTDLVDVLVEPDPEDPSMILVSFKRKAKKDG